MCVCCHPFQYFIGLNIFYLTSHFLTFFLVAFPCFAGRITSIAGNIPNSVGKITKYGWLYGWLNPNILLAKYHLSVGKFPHLVGEINSSGVVLPCN